MQWVAPELLVPDLKSYSLGRDPGSLRDAGCSATGAGPDTRDGRPLCGSGESGLAGPAPSRGRPDRRSHLTAALAKALTRPGLPPARPLLATVGTASRPPPLWPPNQRVPAHLCSAGHAPLLKLDGTPTSDPPARPGSNFRYPLSLLEECPAPLHPSEVWWIKVSYPSLQPLELGVVGGEENLSNHLLRVSTHTYGGLKSNLPFPSSLDSARSQLVSPSGSSARTCFSLLLGPLLTFSPLQLPYYLSKTQISAGHSLT